MKGWRRSSEEDIALMKDAFAPPEVRVKGEIKYGNFDTMGQLIVWWKGGVIPPETKVLPPVPYRPSQTAP
jgi:hypothetical protein